MERLGAPGGAAGAVSLPRLRDPAVQLRRRVQTVPFRASLPASGPGPPRAGPGPRPGGSSIFGVGGGGIISARPLPRPKRPVTGPAGIPGGSRFFDTLVAQRGAARGPVTTARKPLQYSTGPGYAPSNGWPLLRPRPPTQLQDPRLPSERTGSGLGRHSAVNDGRGPAEGLRSDFHLRPPGWRPTVPTAAGPSRAIAPLPRRRVFSSESRAYTSDDGGRDTRVDIARRRADDCLVPSESQEFLGEAKRVYPRHHYGVQPSLLRGGLCVSDDARRDQSERPVRASDGRFDNNEFRDVAMPRKKINLVRVDRRRESAEGADRPQGTAPIPRSTRGLPAKDAATRRSSWDIFSSSDSASGQSPSPPPVPRVSHRAAEAGRPTFPQALRKPTAPREVSPASFLPDQKRRRVPLSDGSPDRALATKKSFPQTSKPARVAQAVPSEGGRVAVDRGPRTLQPATPAQASAGASSAAQSSAQPAREPEAARTPAARQGSERPKTSEPAARPAPARRKPKAACALSSASTNSSPPPRAADTRTEPSTAPARSAAVLPGASPGASASAASAPAAPESAGSPASRAPLSSHPRLSRASPSSASSSVSSRTANLREQCRLVARFLAVSAGIIRKNPALLICDDEDDEEGKGGGGPSTDPASAPVGNSDALLGVEKFRRAVWDTAKSLEELEDEETIDSSEDPPTPQAQAAAKAASVLC